MTEFWKDFFSVPKVILRCPLLLFNSKQTIYSVPAPCSTTTMADVSTLWKDIALHSDGSIWFSDPIYGFDQGIRPPPELPNQVYS